MCVREIFQKGEFNKIRDKGEPFKVGNILHKATIDVDDKGVIAATGIELLPLIANLNTGELYVCQLAFHVHQKRYQKWI